jgi:tRNA pseudouridine55 synthase
LRHQNSFFSCLDRVFKIALRPCRKVWLGDGFGISTAKQLSKGGARRLSRAPSRGLQARRGVFLMGFVTKMQTALDRPVQFDEGHGALGWMIIDKARGQTSMDVTYRVRKAFGLRKAGHAGTLDPLATGILPVALGQTTALIPHVMALPKAYSFTVRWGESTTTDDCLGDVVAQAPGRPTCQQIQGELAGFVGSISQIPPAYCAAKISGVPAYTLARRGQSVVLAARKVSIFDLQLCQHRGDESDFVVTCGSGTYVRSLGRDLAIALGTVGHVVALRRIRVGHWQEGIDTQALWQLQGSDRLAQIVPADSGLPPQMMRVHVSNWARRQLWNGQVLDVGGHCNQLLWAPPHQALNSARPLQASASGPIYAPSARDSQTDRGPVAWSADAFGQPIDGDVTALDDRALQDAAVACYDAKSRLVAVAKLTTGGLAPSRCFMERL